MCTCQATYHEVLIRSMSQVDFDGRINVSTCIVYVAPCIIFQHTICRKRKIIVSFVFLFDLSTGDLSVLGHLCVIVIQGNSHK